MEPTRPTDLRTRLDRLQVFLEQDPDNLNLLADIADLALSLGETAVARSAIQHALEVKPDDPFFRLRLSASAIAEGNFEGGASIAEALIAEGHTDAAIRYNRAFALASMSRHAEARRLLEDIRSDDPRFPGAVPLLIRCCHYLGDLDTAIAIALDHLQTNAEDRQVAGMLSLLYFDRNEFALAEEWAQRVLAGNPNDLDALLAGAGAALANEDVDSAKALTHRAIGVQPQNGRAWANLGLAELLAFDLPKARNALAVAVKHMPKHIGTWIALGWTQMLQGDVDAAEASFRSALSIDENFGETHGGLAAVAAMRGAWDEAENSAKIARRLDPDSMSPQYVQVVRMLREGESNSAQRFMRHALAHKSAPAGGSLLDMLLRLSGRPGKGRLHKDDGALDRETSRRP